jgi:hypothetical protein
MAEWKYSHMHSLSLIRVEGEWSASCSSLCNPKESASGTNALPVKYGHEPSGTWNQESALLVMVSSNSVVSRSECKNILS